MENYKIYYCKNANDDEELIGMGIFNIEDQTRRYITAKLKTLPSRRRSGSAQSIVVGRPALR